MDSDVKIYNLENNIDHQVRKIFEYFPSYPQHFLRCVCSVFIQWWGNIKNM